MPPPSPDNSREFRNALGCFATGVTVITTLNEDGEPAGVTIGSFTSLSLTPPLILWSLALSACCIDVFRKARYFAVNVLAADQHHLSDRFAVKGKNRFAGVPVNKSKVGLPLIEGCCAWFECRNETSYPGGDHLILIGQVEHFRQDRTKVPLIFHQGRYCSIVEPALRNPTSR